MDNRPQRMVRNGKTWGTNTRGAVTRLLLAFSCALPVYGLPAAAQQAYPDIRGTWTGTTDHVQIAGDDANASFGSQPFTVVISEQRDRFFVGQIDVGAGSGQALEFDFVGAFANETQFSWTQTEGFVNGWMLDEHTIETCYLRLTATLKVAACGNMVRQD